jgi:hypothetical protein
MRNSEQSQKGNPYREEIYLIGVVDPEKEKEQLEKQRLKCLPRGWLKSLALQAKDRMV